MRIDKKLVARLLDIDEAEIPSLGGLSFKLDAPSDTFGKLLEERQRRRFESLSAALRNEDDLGKVVRAHIHIEHELQDFIFFAAPMPDQLKSFDTLEFTDKVQLALHLGLSPDLKAALNATGRLRNKFAHRLDMKIGEDEAKNLIATLTPSAKQRFQARLDDALSGSASAPDKLDSAFVTVATLRPNSLIVLPDGMFFGQHRRIVALTLASHLPTLFSEKEVAEAGGLMAYGPSIPVSFRRAAAYVDKILRGAKPADLPVEQPTKFEFVINLKTAKALGLTVSNQMQLLADEVIE